MYHRSPETFFTDFREKSMGCQNFMRKIASIMMFCYSDILPSASERKKNSMQSAIEELYELLWELTELAVKDRTVERTFNTSERPGIYYPPLSTSGSDMLKMSPRTNVRRRAKFSQFNAASVGSSSNFVFRLIEEISDGTNTVNSESLGRPTLQAFTMMYEALLNGEIPNLSVDGFIPIRYMGQPVESKPHNLGALHSATTAFPQGLNSNQLLFLTANDMVVYHMNPPSTPMSFLFRITDDGDEYCLMKVQNSRVEMKIIPNWDYCKSFGYQLVGHGSSSWAMGDSVFEFSWSPPAQTIEAYNYGVKGFVV